MTLVLVSSDDDPGAPPLVADLAAAGFQVGGTADCADLLRSAIKDAPDLIVVYDRSPGAVLFGGTAAIAANAPRPVVVFTVDPDAEKIALAMRSGIHAYVVNGYTQNRLRSVIHLAQARFRHERLIRDELTEVNRRFAERKLVDRAKGILMGARQLREEEAYRALRTAAMHTKQRIGQVAQRVIDAAHYAEAVNRAGQLRMLSQRVAKLYALACAGIRPTETAGLLSESVEHMTGNLASLSRSLSKATFGDLLDAVSTAWTRLHAVLAAPAAAARFPDVDREAGEMLRRAEQLTANLEMAGAAPALRAVNVSGRQRMLSQRLAKEALVAALPRQPDAKTVLTLIEASRAQFLEGMEYLQHLPLSNADIDRELAAAAESWRAFEAALSQAGTAQGKNDIADTSEALLSHFERLTDQLERGLQALL